MHASCKWQVYVLLDLTTKHFFFKFPKDEMKVTTFFFYSFFVSYPTPWVKILVCYTSTRSLNTMWIFHEKKKVSFFLFYFLYRSILHVSL